MHSSRYHSPGTKVKSSQVKFAAKHTSQLRFAFHSSAIRATIHTQNNCLTHLTYPYYKETNKFLGVPKMLDNGIFHCQPSLLFLKQSWKI